MHRDGIAVTTVARTLLDLAATVSEYQLRHAIKQAEILQLFDLRAVRALLQRHPRHRGARLLSNVLRTWIDPPKTRSVLEEWFPTFCTRHGLPQPIMNGTIEGYEIDAHFPLYRVAVEFDGYRFHRGIISWEDDHERRNRLVAAGWEYLSFTYRQQTDDGGRAVLETLRPTMRRREPSAGELG